MTETSKLSQEIAAKLYQNAWLIATDRHTYEEEIAKVSAIISEGIAPLDRERDELKGEVAYNQLEAYKENKRAEAAESQLSSLSLAVKELHPFLKHTKECNITTEYKVYSPVSKGIGLPVWEQQPCNCGLGAAAERARTLVTR